MNKKLPLLFLSLFITWVAMGQVPAKPHAGEIHHALEKLNFLGTVLYVAAHPDDENTRMISYLSNEEHARTAYLSITRGDGGQNLIGPEIRELLGLIRTNELLRARSIDGGEQFFTRANDFGYSKHPDETMDIWNRKEVLKDVVTIIREFRPDVIINRFNAESAGETHGHHTSSAILSTEAFELSASKAFETPGLEPWKTERLFFNTHWWFYGSREAFEKVDKSGMLAFDTGVYFPSLGLSNSEIASLSRSMHKSQGFGSTGTRGTELEYIQLLQGTMPENKSDLFEGINTTWTRVRGGEAIQRILDEVEHDFDFKDPSGSIPRLVEAYDRISKLEDAHWREFKTQQVKELIAACAGLYLEARTGDPYSTAGETIGLQLEAINRSDQAIRLESVTMLPTGQELAVNEDLSNNIPFSMDRELQIPGTARLTSPYWLDQPGTLGMYQVGDPSLIGRPLTPHELKVAFHLNIAGKKMVFYRNLVQRFNDPVKGEVQQPFEVVPEVSVSVASDVILFDEAVPREVPVTVRAYRDNLEGTLSLRLPEGWKSEPAQQDFRLQNKGGEKSLVFIVTPTEGQSEGYLRPVVHSGGKDYERTITEINYDHIPRQMVLMPAASRVVRIDLDKKGNSIGYIQGAGDDIPKYLQQVGYEVTLLDVSEISSGSLEAFDAVILGIRAYNTLPELKNKQAHLLEYVHQGGNLVVQYNTNQRLVVDDLAPYALEISRDRITDETSEVTFLSPGQEVLNFPNKIVKKDFDGWVQERGLYFPDKWGEEFTPVLSFQENGEAPMNGGLLVAKYGKGHYVYTGLSFFRELPAGVPGAYKLFTNMLSLGKNDFEQQLKE